MLTNNPVRLNPLDVITTERRETLVNAINAAILQIHDYASNERHWSIWTRGQKASYMRTCLTNQIKFHLGRLEGVRCIDKGNAFLILFDDKVIMHIKRLDEVTLIGDIPKLLSKDDIILVYKTHDVQIPFPEWEEFMEDVPDLNQIAAEEDIRMCDVDKLVGGYLTDDFGAIAKFYITLQAGKSIVEQREIDLTPIPKNIIDYGFGDNEESSNHFSDNDKDENNDDEKSDDNEASGT